MSLVLLFSCVMQPIQLAFIDEGHNIAWQIINVSQDFLFAFDMIVVFNTAFYTEDLEINSNRCDIAKRYIEGWFLIDFIAIFPFSIIMSSS
jgi:hypothetical protein